MIKEELPKPSHKANLVSSAVSKNLAPRENKPITPVLGEISLADKMTSLSAAYAKQVIIHHLFGAETLKALLLNAAIHKISTLVSESAIGYWLGWLTEIGKLLKDVSEINPNALAAILWLVGKVYYSISRWYDPTSSSEAELEQKVHRITTGTQSVHEKLKWTVLQIESWYRFLKKEANKFVYGKQDVQADKGQQTLPHPDKYTDPDKPRSSGGSFIQLSAQNAQLDKFTDHKGKDRQGVVASTKLRLSLLGRVQESKLAVKLPYGPGWSLTVNDFFTIDDFEPMGLFKIEKINGDQLTINEEGLEILKLSLHKFDVADGKVKAGLISGAYDKGAQAIDLEAKKIEIPLWQEHKLLGDLGLTLNTKGGSAEFQSASVAVKTSKPIELIKSHLTLTEAGGSIKVYKDKMPDMSINAKLGVKALDDHLTGNASVTLSYDDEGAKGAIDKLELTGDISNASKITLSLKNATVSNKGISCDDVEVAYEYKKSAEEKQDSQAGSALQQDNNSLQKWLQYSKILNLSNLRIAAGVDGFSLNKQGLAYKETHFGVTDLEASVLGLSVSWHENEEKGSIGGKLEQIIKTPDLQLDLPFGVAAGATIGVYGHMNFGAEMKGAVEPDKDKKTPDEKWLKVSADAKAWADAGLQFTAGAYVGVSNVASISANLEAGIGGKVTGISKLSWGVLQSAETAKEKYRPHDLQGEYQLEGTLSANVSGNVKGRILIFTKTLTKVTIGEWEIGTYRLSGKMVADEKGKINFKTDKKSGFGTIKKPNWEEEQLKIEKWLAELKTQKDEGIKLTKYDDKEVTKVVEHIIYGPYFNQEKLELMCLYRELLDGDHQELLDQLWEKIGNKILSFDKEGVLWTSEDWRMLIGFNNKNPFSHNKSEKKAISDLLKKYHTSPGDNKGTEKQLIMSELEKALADYEKVSKSNQHKQKITLLLMKTKSLLTNQPERF